MSAELTTLLDLTAQARELTDSRQVRDLLVRAHPLYCHAAEIVRADVRHEASTLNDTELRARCSMAGAPWEPGSSRQDAIAELIFTVFSDTPAALAYQALADIAHRHHTGLVD